MNRQLAYLLVSSLALVACKKKAGHDDSSSEKAYIDGEIAELKTQLAARDESKAEVSCMSATVSIKRMPAATVKEIERMCYSELPRLHLELAIADVQKTRADTPALSADMSCMQLFVGDAFKAKAHLEAPDPQLEKLAAEYEKLCPAAVAKIRARAGATSSL
ncbi:MAG TPA: hypothetical protein VL326_18510 [Kofleriaceae bacterium]|jgi:hypothetical protein|nr:hypothetical protein [Kofleriaceae bacterium]